MNLISTRNSNESVSALNAVLKGIASDGGLYVPEVFPQIDKEKFLEWGKGPYEKCAAQVLAYYFGLSEDELLPMVTAAYSSFSDEEVVPIQKVEGDYYLELFHGPTLAFKDIALALLPHLMNRALRHTDENVLILTATSGDTGKAALEGFKNAPRTAICALYPAGGVSDVQRLQMVTQEGSNVYVAGVEGNFDDAQNAVKALFLNREFRAAAKERGYTLSSANSINFGRLAPQIVYYIYAYARLVAAKEITNGRKINIVVPTGNFGNILAAYYAKRMGLPVHRLICASNKNNVLTDFFESGVYAANREFYKTISPSMDILISSNLERLIFEYYRRDSLKMRDVMRELSLERHYSVNQNIRNELIMDFYGDFADEFPTMNSIKKSFTQNGYLIDPHTAVARTVYEKYKKILGDGSPAIIAATASPYKFAGDVLYAVTKERVEDPFQAAEALARLAGESVPAQLLELRNKKERFADVLTADPEEIGRAILSNILA